MMRHLALGGAAMGSVLLLVCCVGGAPTTAAVGTDAGGPGATVEAGDGDIGNGDAAARASDGDAPRPDTGGNPSDAMLADGASDAPGAPCDLDKPFGLVQPLAGDVNTSDGEEYARVSPNGLELYFARFGAASGYQPHIFRAIRASVSDPWTTEPSPHVALNLAPDGGLAFATAPALTGDGLTVYIQLWDDASSYANIFTASRTRLDTPWNRPVKVANVNHANADDGVWVSSSGGRLYYFTGPPFQIVVAEKSGTAFGPATQFAPMRPDERAPVVSEDELTMYFASLEAPGDAGPNNFYVYRATRVSTDQTFTDPVYVPELNVPGADTLPSWLSKDQCTILLHGTRASGVGSSDIYIAKRPKTP